MARAPARAPIPHHPRRASRESKFRTERWRSIRTHHRLLVNPVSSLDLTGADQVGLSVEVRIVGCEHRIVDGRGRRRRRVALAELGELHKWVAIWPGDSPSQAQDTKLVR